MSETERNCEDQSRDYNPANDPFACSICGCAIGEAKRIRGDEYCDGCKHDTEEYVRCETCGDRVPQPRATGVDVSLEDEYYPEFIYFCPTHAPSKEGDDA